MLPSAVGVVDMYLSLVPNNAHWPSVAPGAALRPRVDEGMLWTDVVGLDGDRLEMNT